MSMKNKVILVTGANRGIGLNILQRLDNDGYTVIGTSRSDDGSNLISKHIKSSDGIGLKMDVTDQESINSAIDIIKDKFDTGECEFIIKRVDMIINIFLMVW